MAKWQTRTVQVRVPERAWGFNSPLAHDTNTPSDLRKRTEERSSKRREGQARDAGSAANLRQSAHYRPRIEHSEPRPIGLWQLISVPSRTTTPNLTRTQVANLLSISVKTVDRAIASQELTAVCVGSNIRISRSAVARWIGAGNHQDYDPAGWEVANAETGTR